MKKLPALQGMSGEREQAPAAEFLPSQDSFEWAADLAVSVYGWYDRLARCD